MKRAAFTLLELLLVLAIIATICGLGITSYQRQYARAQFKSGVVQIQVDLHKTRLLAMQSGEAYLFRYVPGTGVYEIAPLKTLQEVLYRIHGDAEDLKEDALGGSLSLSSTNSSLFSSDSAYSDDLFSTENIEADIAAKNRALRDTKQTNSSFNSSSLGGSLNSIQSGNVEQLSTHELDVLNGDMYVSSNASLTGEGVGVLDSPLNASAVSMNFRDLNAQEKSLAKDNSLAWRVNGDGVIVRKQATGDVVFTVLRISKSTPSNLRTRRPQSSTSENSSNGLNGTASDKAESVLGGSLTSIPDGSESDEGLGGGLTDLPGDVSSTNALATVDEEAQTVSLWSEPILFYPNGKTSSAVLGLESVGDYPYYSEIAIRGMTGVARISSISAVPPGATPGASVLTREQLFRLSNPMKQNVESLNAGLATSGALGVGADSMTSDSTSVISNALGETNEFNLSSDNLLSGEQTPSVNYGTGRRSGYNFNENVASSTNDVPLGVSLNQNETPTLNASTHDMNVDGLNDVTSNSNIKQSETTEENSTLNGGLL